MRVSPSSRARSSRTRKPEMPSAAHIVFIPGVFLVGLVFGYVMGARAVRAEVERKRKKQKE